MTEAYLCKKSSNFFPLEGMSLYQKMGVLLKQKASVNIQNKL
jgi:hypothetical protein